jgi:hypothetical protein
VNYGDMTLVEHDSERKLFGLFQANVVHSMVHLLFGVSSLVAASAWGSGLFLIGGSRSLARIATA